MRSGYFSVLAPVGDDAAVQIVGRQVIAKGDQSPVGCSLGGKQRLWFIERHEIVMSRGANAALFEKIEIEMIDSQDVIERCLDRREEAGSLGFEFTGRKAAGRRGRAGRSTRDCCVPCSELWSSKFIPSGKKIEPTLQGNTKSTLIAGLSGSTFIITTSPTYLFVLCFWKKFLSYYSCTQRLEETYSYSYPIGSWICRKKKFFENRSA